MYTASHRQRKRRPLIGFLILFGCISAVVAFVLWWFLIRGDDLQVVSVGSTATREVGVAEPTTEYRTSLYRIELPLTWIDKGRKNPVSDSVYYEYQNTAKNYDNRYLRIYVDKYPADLPINKLLPVTAVNNTLVPAVVSEDCSSFSMPANQKPATPKPDFIAAKWQGVSFTCDLKQTDNKVGTASAEEGYGATVQGSNGEKHRYFFVYIERNVRADYQFLPTVIKSFKAL